MFFDDKYKLWQFPQGGIDNRETLLSAMQRELEEELGNDISKHIVGKPEFLFEDKISFPEKLWGSRELKLDDGMKMFMKGKHFFYIAVEIDLEKFDMKDSEFSEYRLMTAKESDKLIDQIYQFNKQRISRKAIEHLIEKELLL